MFNWLMDFLRGRTIQVKVGAELSSKQGVENGMPQGSVVSPTLFSIMIELYFCKCASGHGKVAVC